MSLSFILIPMFVTFAAAIRTATRFAPVRRVSHSLEASNPIRSNARVISLAHRSILKTARRATTLLASHATPTPATWSSLEAPWPETLIPTLSSNSYKGSSGRIGVLGGSARYTGAPYYAAMSALRCGSDLAFVFCAEEAAVPIKCYSPELMVAAVYDAKEFDRIASKLDSSGSNADMRKAADRLVAKMVDEVTSLFDRMHVLVVGPGLGRCPLVLEATAHILRRADEAGVPVVVDADALWLLTLESYKDLFSGKARTSTPVVLTPNVVEYRRLLHAFGGESLLHRSLSGCVIVQKGFHDTITLAGNDDTRWGSLRCEEIGGLKRSGGIGDVLAGTLGTFVAWNRILADNEEIDSDTRRENLALACWSACCVVKKCARNAFAKRRRAMTAPDVLEEIGQVVDGMTGFDTIDG